MAYGRSWVRDDDYEEENRSFEDYCKIAEYELGLDGVYATRADIKDEAARMILGRNTDFESYQEEYKIVHEDLAYYAYYIPEKDVINAMRRNRERCSDKVLDATSSTSGLASVESIPIKALDSVDTESDADRAKRIALNNCKMMVREKLTGYYNRFTLFMHHYDRAIEVNAAISRATTISEIQDILENQESLFSASENVDTKMISSSLLKDRFSRELKNKATVKETSAYYKSIVSALTLLKATEKEKSASTQVFSPNA